jgi:hypothetical protein
VALSATTGYDGNVFNARNARRRPRRIEANLRARRTQGRGGAESGPSRGLKIPQGLTVKRIYVGATMSFADLKVAIDLLGDRQREFHKGHQERLDALKKDNGDLRERLEELESRQRGPGKTPGEKSIGAPAFELIDAEGKRFPALTKKQSFAEYARTLPGESDQDADFSLGEHVRGVMLGRKVASSSAWCRR